MIRNYWFPFIICCHSQGYPYSLQNNPICIYFEDMPEIYIFCDLGSCASSYLLL